MSNIEEIIQVDRQAFYDYISRSQRGLALDLPHDVCRYLLIPPRILELVRTPANVDVDTYVMGSDRSLWGTVYYWNPIPLFEHTLLVRQWRQLRMYTHAVLQTHLVSQIHDPDSPLLFVDDYSDKAHYRGRGVATSFYKRLRECAIAMGYRFIYGFNTTPGTQRFFVESVGRTPLGKTKPEIWQLLASTYDFSWTRNFNAMTIDFLRDADKEKFVEPNPDNPTKRWFSYFFERS